MIYLSDSTVDTYDDGYGGCMCMVYAVEHKICVICDDVWRYQLLLCVYGTICMVV